MRNCFQSVVRLCVSSFFHKLWFQKLKDTPPFREAGWSPAAKWRVTVAFGEVKSEEWKVKNLCYTEIAESTEIIFSTTDCSDWTDESVLSLFIFFWTRIARIERMDPCYPLDPCSYNISVYLFSTTDYSDWTDGSVLSVRFVFVWFLSVYLLFDHGLLGLNGWMLSVRSVFV